MEDKIIRKTVPLKDAPQVLKELKDVTDEFILTIQLNPRKGKLYARP